MIEYTIICDGCSQLGDASKASAAVARKALRDEGGWRVNLPGGQDLCDCCGAGARQAATDTARSLTSGGGDRG